MEEVSSVERFGDDFGAERMWGLRELPLPDSTSLFPQTIGWLYLSLLFVSLLLLYALHRYHRWQQQAYRREAKISLANMRYDLTLITGLPGLLRSVALRSASRETVIGLHGKPWIEWLNRTAKKDLFDAQDGELLNRLAYEKSPAVDEFSRHRLIDACEQWLGMDHV